jgi:hypothetical protein
LEVFFGEEVNVYNMAFFIMSANVSWVGVNSHAFGHDFHLVVFWSKCALRSSPLQKGYHRNPFLPMVFWCFLLKPRLSKSIWSLREEEFLALTV